MGLVGAVSAQTWPVTSVHVRVSQDDAGSITTTTDRPDLWTGTWSRAVEFGKYHNCEVSGTAVGKIVGMGPITGSNCFYGVPPMGVGAYYMETHYSDCSTVPMNKVYIGTDFLAGTAITDILTLKYCTQVRYRGFDGQSHTYQGQPPMIELITDSGATTQQRRFWYKPWGEFGMTNVLKNAWQEWDCLTGGHWEAFSTSVNELKGDWAWLKSYKPGKSLRSPLVGDYMNYYTVVDGNYMLSNNTGTCLAIKQGSGGPAFDKDGAKPAWWTETSDVHSFVDKLEVGVATGWNGETPAGEIRYIFDFENGDGVANVIGALSNKASLNQPVQQLQDSNLFVLFGRMVPDHYEAGISFGIDDGTGVPVKVFAPNHQFAQATEFDNWFVRVEGRVAHATAGGVPFTVIYTWPDKIVQYQ